MSYEQLPSDEAAKEPTERYLTIAEAAKRIPGRPSVCTMWRWWRKGLRGGVKLRSVAIGGKRLIPETAIPEFIAACSSADRVSTPSVQQPRTNRQRAAAIKRAKRILASK